MTGFPTSAKLALLAAGCAAALGLAMAPTAADPPPDQPAPAEKPAGAAEVRIGAARFRAAAPIGDARYAAGGKKIVGTAGTTLHVWDAGDGTLLRSIPTGLGLLEDPTRHGEKHLAFAAHPRMPRVACGGVKDGRTTLQVWDFETGKMVAERAAAGDALKALAWTADGRLLERSNVGWEKPTGWKLVVRSGALDEVRSHDLPRDFGDWSSVMLPLPGGKEVMLWQSGREPTVFDLDSGAAVRTVAHQPSIPSDLAVSPDGKTLMATSTTELCLFDLAAGGAKRPLPVLRGGWEKPRPLFSPDGATVYLWDHRPVAYDVATGKEKWKPFFQTVHTVQTSLCDVSPDGATVLVRHGHALARLDAKTGAERDPPGPPSYPAGLVWSPDGRTLFTRAERHDRTWTAWDAATGRRLYHLRPAGFVADEDWKLLPDLFFPAGGREIVAGLERRESTETSGPKDLFVFDAATGRCLRRLGEPLPVEPFRWAHPIAADPDGATVVWQDYAVSAKPGFPGGPALVDTDREDQFATFRWDPAKKAKVQSWTVFGNRVTPPRHYEPFALTVAAPWPRPGMAGKMPPAKLRCYSLTDGRLVHELPTAFASADPDRVERDLLLSVGYDSTWVSRGNTIRYTAHAPFACDLWELPGRAAVRLFETDRRVPVVLGPGSRFLLRVPDNAGFEVYEPFAVKAVVTKVATPARPVSFEFAPDGGRVAVSLADASVVVLDATPWRRAAESQVAAGVPADLAPLWDDLAKDPAAGLRAARLLGAAGDRAVALLRGKIAAMPAADAAAVRRLVADLDAPNFAAREAAEKGLRALSGRAEPQLREALRANPSAEARQRLDALLAAVEARTLTADELREVRAVRALEWADTEAARALLAAWAKGDPTAALTKAAGR